MLMFVDMTRSIGTRASCSATFTFYQDLQDSLVSVETTLWQQIIQDECESLSNTIYVNDARTDSTITTKQDCRENFAQ